MSGLGASLSEFLRVHFGQTSSAEARVYVDLAGRDVAEGTRLSGVISGPQCAWSRTLSARLPLAPCRGAGPPLAEAIVPDPCFWSPELPFLYEARVEIQVPGQATEVVERTFGIRPLGVVGKRLVAAGKTWVCRGVRRQSVVETPLEEWRRQEATMVVDEPPEWLLGEASRLGVGVLARLGEGHEPLVRKLARACRWPAVLMVELSRAPSGEPAATWRAAAPNTILVEPMAGEPDRAPAEWAWAVVCDVGSADSLGQFSSGCRLPVLARRRLDARCELAAARRACDLLQRDLAGLAEAAGYIV